MTKIAIWGNSSGSKYWRLADPAKYLNKTGEFEVKVVDTGINEEWAKWADIYILQGVVDKEGIALLRAYQQEQGKKIIVDMDDMLEVDEDSPFKAEHNAVDAKEVLEIVLRIADLVTTTTEYLAHDLRRYNKKVVVLPNMMDLERWDKGVSVNTGSKLRILWAGSITHLNDIKLLKRAVGEFKEVADWICIGDPRIADELEGVEIYSGVPFDKYPSRLNGLHFDIGVAPLVDSKFNRCKSDIKVLEYGINGVPTVASNVEPYFDLIGKVMLAADEDDFVKHITTLVTDENLRVKMGNEIREYVLNERNLEKEIDRWVQAYKSVV